MMRKRQRKKHVKRFVSMNKELIDACDTTPGSMARALLDNEEVVIKRFVGTPIYAKKLEFRTK